MWERFSKLNNTKPLQMADKKGDIEKEMNSPEFVLKTEPVVQNDTTYIRLVISEGNKTFNFVEYINEIFLRKTGKHLFSHIGRVSS